MLIFHIIVALSSLIVGVGLLFRPHQTTLKASYGLIATTALTGVVLVATGHSVLHVCATGIVYTLAMVILSAGTHRQLATQ